MNIFYTTCGECRNSWKSSSSNWKSMAYSCSSKMITTVTVGITMVCASFIYPHNHVCIYTFISSLNSQRLSSEYFSTVCCSFFRVRMDKVQQIVDKLQTAPTWSSNSCCNLSKYTLEFSIQYWRSTISANHQAYSQAHGVAQWAVHHRYYRVYLKCNSWILNLRLLSQLFQ